MKIFTRFMTLLLINSLVLHIISTETDEPAWDAEIQNKLPPGYTLAELLQIPEPEIETRTEDYTVTLDGLCPNAPSAEAIECERFYNLSHSVSDILDNSTQSYQNDKYKKLLDLSICTSSKIQNLNMSLDVYCYFKGFKENFLAEFGQITNVAEFNNLIVGLEEKIGEEKRPSVIEFLENLLGEVQLLKGQMDSLQNITTNDVVVQNEDQERLVTN